jgi:hypothetical protein
MSFMWISEQTAIISLYSINWLVFITETENVYCAVRTGSLNTTQDRILGPTLHAQLVPWTHVSPHASHAALPTISKFRHNAAPQTQNSVQMLNSHPLQHTSSIPPAFFTYQPSTLFPAYVYRDEWALPGNFRALKCFVVPRPSRNNNNNNNKFSASHHQHSLTSVWLSLRAHCVNVPPV